jgi:hypothetical protein
MKHDSKLIERAIALAPPEQVALNEGLQQVVHDVQNCLHVIGLGTEILKEVRGDDSRFAEVCEGIDRERREAMRRLREYLLSSHDGH